MGRDPEDYLAGAGDDSADMTADASLLGYLQLSGDTETMSTRLTEQPPSRKGGRREED